MVSNMFERVKSNDESSDSASDSENQILLSDQSDTKSDDALSLNLSEDGRKSFLPIELKVYKRRWFILAIFSLLSFTQCAVWNTWGPIANSSLAAYPSWGKSTIALFGNWGTITFVIFTIPFIWLCEAYGLRVGILVSTFLMALGTAIRCISSSEDVFTWMAHIGANLNGVAGIVFCSAPPALSALWFPPNERTTATAISSTFNQLGNAGGFLLGPLLVHDPEAANQTWPPSETELRLDIQKLMDIEAIVCTALFVLVLVYFPAKPKLPPSVASAIPRLDIKQGVAQLLRNREVLLLTTAFSISQGILGNWVGVMDINLDIIDVSQAESSLLGICSIVASSFMALIVARLTDVLTGHMKLTITILMLISTGAFSVLALMCLKLIPTSTFMLYFTIIAGSCSTYAASPLFYELAAEVAFPVDETIVGGFMSCLYNSVGAIFLFAFFIPDIGVIWMNYCLAAAPALALPFIFMAKEDYRRSNLDKDPHQKPLILAVNTGLDDGI